jgi:CRP/FNR family transcriptional regulator, cyclic AMP receptor protein
MNGGEMENLKSALEHHPFLRDMPAIYLKKIEELASFQKFEAGEFLFRQGHQATNFYLLLQGQVDLELFSASGGPVVLQRIRQGEVIGWSWFVPPFLWRFDARAVEPTQVACLDAVRLEKEMHGNHSFGYDVLRRLVGVITERLESARSELLELYAAHT